MTDFTSPPGFQISWEECDKITVHTLKHYMRIVEEDESANSDDIWYNNKLKESIDFILGYFGAV